eukprot:3293196-Rhodomonas_salina.1
MELVEYRWGGQRVCEFHVGTDPANQISWKQPWFFDDLTVRIGKEEDLGVVTGGHGLSQSRSTTPNLSWINTSGR